MLKDKHKRQNLIIELFVITIFSLANASLLYFRLCRGDFQFQDFHARWQECAYFFRGINPFDVLDGRGVIEDIGNIDLDMVTVPWAWIWGVFINPGLISYKSAQIYGICVYIAVPFVTAYVCYYYCRTKQEMPKLWSLLVAISVITQYSWIWSFLCGNHGALACCFIIIAVLTYSDHCYLAGFLMTLAMIKPQVALPFLFVFLLIKEYRLISTVIINELVTILLIQLVLKVNIFSLLKASAGVGTELEGVYFGLFNMLKYTGVSTSIILVIDMIIGMAFTLHVMRRMGYIGNRKESDLEEKAINIDVFWGATIASTFWFYKQSHDFVILALIVIILMQKIYGEKIEKRQWKYIFIQVIIMILFYMQSIFRHLCLRMFPSISEALSKEIFTNISAIILIIITVIYIGILCNDKKDEKNTL